MQNVTINKIMEKELKELKDFVWNKVKKQDESIEQVKDVMLWRTKEFKTMRVEWEIQHEKVKAMDKYLANYIITTDETHGKDMEWRDTKIESQAKRIKELEKDLSETQEQLAYSYDSGYSSEDSPEQHPPEVTEEDARQAFGQDEYYSKP